MVAVETYNPNDADLSVQIGKINGAGGGAIIKMGQGGSTVTAAKNIRQLGLDKILLLASLDDGETFLQAGEILGERFMFVAPGVQVPESIPAGPARQPRRTSSRSGAKSTAPATPTHPRVHGIR